jgi:hypothetical protein
MANEIKDKFTTTPLVITLAGLVDGAARQCTLVPNSTPGYNKVDFAVKVKLGTNPTGNTNVVIYLIKGDGTIRTDGAGAVDAAFVPKSASIIGVLPTGASPNTGDVLQGVFTVYTPGKEFGIAIENNTEVALDSTEGNHSVSYTGMLPEIQ